MEEDIKKIEKDTSKEVDDLHIKLPDGRVILKSKRVFRTRQAELKDGRKVEVTLDDTIYERGKGGALLRLNGKPRLSKAEKKAAKRQKTAERRAL